MNNFFLICEFIYEVLTSLEVKGGGLKYEGRYCVCFHKSFDTEIYCVQVVKDWEILATWTRCSAGTYPFEEKKLFIPVAPSDSYYQYNSICILTPSSCGYSIPYTSCYISRSANWNYTQGNELGTCVDVYSL